MSGSTKSCDGSGELAWVAQIPLNAKRFGDFQVPDARSPDVAARRFPNSGNEIEVLSEPQEIFDLLVQAVEIFIMLNKDARFAKRVFKSREPSKIELELSLKSMSSS